MKPLSWGLHLGVTSPREVLGSRKWLVSHGVSTTVSRQQNDLKSVAVGRKFWKSGSLSVGAMFQAVTVTAALQLGAAPVAGRSTPTSGPCSVRVCGALVGCLHPFLLGRGRLPCPLGLSVTRTLGHVPSCSA